MESSRCVSRRDSRLFEREGRKQKSGERAIVDEQVYPAVDEREAKGILEGGSNDPGGGVCEKERPRYRGFPGGEGN